MIQSKRIALQVGAQGGFDGEQFGVFRLGRQRESADGKESQQ